MKKFSIIGLVLVVMIGIAGCSSADQLAGNFGVFTDNVEQLANAAMAAGQNCADPETETTQETTLPSSDPQNAENTQANIDNNKAANNGGGNKNGGAAVNNRTSAPAKTTAKAATPTAAKTQAHVQPQTTKSTTKATTKAATTKATTTRSKQRGYYVCNGCGYKSTDSSAKDINAHMKKRILAGYDECGSYKTAWM